MDILHLDFFICKLFGRLCSSYKTHRTILSNIHICFRVKGGTHQYLLFGGQVFYFNFSPY